MMKLVVESLVTFNIFTLTRVCDSVVLIVSLCVTGEVDMMKSKREEAEKRSRRKEEEKKRRSQTNFKILGLGI